MSKPARIPDAERPALSDDEFWDRMVRLHLAQAALIRQWRGRGAGDVVESSQTREAPKKPRFIGS